MANEIYEQCINNPNILQHGDSFLSQYLLNTPQFAEQSLQLIFNQNCTTRKYICILFKNILLLNWEQIQGKEALTQIILNGLLVEQNIQILEIITALLCEIVRREQCYQIIPYLLQQSNQSPHLLDVLIYFYANLDDRLNQYTDQVLQQLLNMPNSAKVFVLVYYTMKACTFCQETDIDFLHKCLDGTFIKWIERFQQVLQLHDVEQSIYVVKTLNIIFTDMPAYSKSIRRSIVPFLQQYLIQLSQTPCVLDDINFYSDFQEIEHSLEVLIFYTVQTTLSLASTQVCTFEIYGALLLMLNIPSKCAHIEQYINEDDPSVKKTILLFFEEQLGNRKTKNQAKQYLVQYLQEPQDLEYKYIIIENFVLDLIDKNQMFPLIDQVIGNQNVSLRKLCTATAIYEKTKGNEEYLKLLFGLNYQGLMSESSTLGIVYLFNLGKLSSHALQNETNIQENIQVLNLNYQLNEEIAHLYFDSILQLIRLFHNIKCDILHQAYQYWITNPHDYMNTTIILEIIDFISKTNWDSVYLMFSNTNGHIWLQVTIILAKYQPQRLQDKILPLMSQMNNPQNYEYLCKCTMLLKTLLWQNTIDDSYRIPLLQTLHFQLQLHQDVEIEASTEHVHDLLLVVWYKYLNRQTTQELVNSVCNKIIHTQTPSTTQGLCTLLSCMLYDSPLFNILNLEEVLQKWLKYSTVFRGIQQQQIQFNYLYKLSFNPILDHLHYKDPYLSIVKPMKLKILEFLISFKSLNKTIKLVEEDEFQDDEDSQETDFDQDIKIEVSQVLQFDIGHLQQYVQYLSRELQMSLQNINK